MKTWTFQNAIYVEASGTVVGPKEAAGPLSESFDQAYQDLYCGEESWELAERKLMEDAISHALKKANKKQEDIDFFIAGDLLNQMITSNYNARKLAIPYLGVFSACATVMEAVAIGAMMIDGGFANSILLATSSHHAASERQFRYPNEFGYQKQETASYTVTGAGACILSKKKTYIKVKAATIGTVVDYEMKNPYQFGATMAPAAAATIKSHLENTNTSVDDYDCIITGDLARVGSGILHKLLEEEEIKLSHTYDDCGTMIYYSDQAVNAGGSGAACCAVVTFGHVFELMSKGVFKKVLVVATGSLLNPFMIYQKQSIPTIAHAVAFEREDM